MINKIIIMISNLIILMYDDDDYDHDYDCGYDHGGFNDHDYQPFLHDLIIH